MYNAIIDLIIKVARLLYKVPHIGVARRAASSVNDAYFVVEVEEELSFLLRVSPTRLRARFLL
ncbi:hypothetical protein J9A15_26750, partial [Escherichia coli]|nr:hypothetical protein [Escherichia coli]